MYLGSETFGSTARDGLAGHMTPKDGIDGVEKAGLPDTDRPEEQNAGLPNSVHYGLVVLHKVQQLLLLSARRNENRVEGEMEE